MHVNDVLNWRPGLTMEIINGNKVVVAEQVIRAARRVLGEPVDGDDTPIAWPEGLTPDEYIASLAERISCWLWQRYTEAQRARMMRYAAAYAIREVQRLVRDVSRAPRVTREMVEAQHPELRRQSLELSVHLSDARKRLVVLLAYVECHPGDEVDGEELAHLTHLVKHGLVGDDENGGIPFF
jgi:hypothetical protein